MFKGVISCRVQNPSGDRDDKKFANSCQNLKLASFLLTDLFQFQLYRGQLGRSGPEDDQRRVPGLPDILEREELPAWSAGADQHPPAERSQHDKV